MSIDVLGLDWSGKRVLPEFQPIQQLEIYDIRGSGPDIQLAATICAGLINSPRPRVYLIVEDDDEDWSRQVMGSIPQMSYAVRGNDVLYALLESYQSVIKGMIIYDPACIDTINVATTLAGIHAGVVVSPELAQILQEKYNLGLLHDLRIFHWRSRLQAYLWAWQHLLPECTSRMMAGMDPKFRTGLRSFLVATRTFVYWLDSRHYLPDGSAGSLSERGLMRRICASYPAGILHLGWVIDEPSGVALTSRAALPVLPSDHFNNLEVWSAIRPDVLSGCKTNLRSKKDVFPDTEAGGSVEIGTDRASPVPTALSAVPTVSEGDDRRIYVSFTMSDGDNIQYCQHRLFEIWQEPVRGIIPLGWTLSPLFLQAAPAMGEYYRRTATANDELIAGPSGIGYMFPSHWPREKLSWYLEQTGEMMERMGMTTLEVLDAERIFGAGWPVISKVCWNGMTMRQRHCQEQYGRTLAAYGVRGILSGAGYLFPSSRWQEVDATPICHNLGLVNSPKMALEFIRGAAKIYRQRPLYLSVYVNAWPVSPTEVYGVMQELGDRYTFVLPRTLLAMLAAKKKRA
jgi:hypothetical protein